MHIKNIEYFYPRENTSLAIKVALREVSEGMEIARECLETAKRDYGELVTTGASQLQKLAAKEEIMRIQALIEELEILHPALAPQLDIAERNERIAGLRSRYDELNAADETAAWAQDFSNRYPVLAAELAQLFEREAALLGKGRLANSLRDQLAKDGVEVPYAPPPAQIVAGGVIAGFQSFGDIMAVLPGLLGGPFIPNVWVEDKRTVMMERPDYDSHGGRDATNAPLKKKWVQETQDHSHYGPARQDVPFWQAARRS